MPVRTLKIDELFPTVAVRLAKPIRMANERGLQRDAETFAAAGEVIRVQGLRAEIKRERVVDSGEIVNADVRIERGDGEFAIGRFNELKGAVPVDVPDGPIEPRALACRAFRDLVKRGEAGFDRYDPEVFIVFDLTVAGRTPPQIAEDLDRLIYLDRVSLGAIAGLCYRFRVDDVGAFVTDDLRLKLAEVGDYQIDTASTRIIAR